MVTHGVFSTGHPYYRFGNGDTPLLVLPGVTAGIGWWNDPDWLTATALERYYFRAYRDYDVWVMPRPPGGERTTTAAMAADYAEVLEALGTANVIGISLGSAIGAHLTAETDLVERLVLISCGTGLGAFGRQTVTRWQEFAAAGRYRELHLDYIRRVYAGRNRLLIPPLYRLGAPWLPKPTCEGDVGRACEAMLSYDGTILSDVSVPSLVVGGKEDSLVPITAHRDAAARLDCSLALAPGGHAVYEESRRDVASAINPFLRGDPLTQR